MSLLSSATVLSLVDSMAILLSQAYQLAGPPFTQPLRLPHHAHRRAPVRGR